MTSRNPWKRYVTIHNTTAEYFAASIQSERESGLGCQAQLTLGTCDLAGGAGVLALVV